MKTAGMVSQIRRPFLEVNNPYITSSETVQKCWKKPQQHCQQVEEEKCTEVPRENCKDVVVKVAKNYCNKKNLNPLEALSEIVDH